MVHGEPDIRMFRAVVMRERIQSNMLEVRHIHGVVQLADLNTKSHPATCLKELRQ